MGGVNFPVIFFTKRCCYLYNIKKTCLYLPRIGSDISPTDVLIKREPGEIPGQARCCEARDVPKNLTPLAAKAGKVLEYVLVRIPAGPGSQHRVMPRGTGRPVNEIDPRDWVPAKRAYVNLNVLRCHSRTACVLPQWKGLIKLI